MMTATVHHQPTDRIAFATDASRPWIAVKPEGYRNRVIGHYTTKRGAKDAAERFNKKTA